MKKVLIVDDQPQVRELVEVTLRDKEYEIICAENGRQAVELAAAQKPDVILMDVMMPGDIDGYEATRMLKRDEQTKDCVIIMLTARGQKGDYEKGLEAGADDYMVKPFSPLELIKKVKEFMP